MVEENTHNNKIKYNNTSWQLHSCLRIDANLNITNTEQKYTVNTKTNPTDTASKNQNNLHLSIFSKLNSTVASTTPAATKPLITSPTSFRLAGERINCSNGSIIEFNIEGINLNNFSSLMNRDMNVDMNNKDININNIGTSNLFEDTNYNIPTTITNPQITTGYKDYTPSIITSFSLNKYNNSNTRPNRSVSAISLSKGNKIISLVRRLIPDKKNKSKKEIIK